MSKGINSFLFIPFIVYKMFKFFIIGYNHQR
ncbi:hypothetical protein SRABI04_01565 [Chryseobacterium sp. Bi04]|nr:hypothetical protein SRABI04_01565 [Chryseobacterium sp. Bi04]